MNLNFNHPVKEIIWGGAPTTATADISATAGPALLAKPTTTTTWQLKLNGHDRMAARAPEYFSRQQIYH